MSEFPTDERFRKLLLTLPGKAIQYLYDSYFHSLLRISKGLTHNHEASLEIVQDAVIHIWENSAKLALESGKPILHYLVRVVRNKSITHYKKHIVIDERIERLSNLNGQSVSYTESSAEAMIVEREIQAEVREIIARFPLKERECLTMKIDQEMTTAQIAAALAVSEKAVERSLTSARKRLRKAWTERNM